jgi:hypothetical protein
MTPTTAGTAPSGASAVSAAPARAATIAPTPPSVRVPPTARRLLENRSGVRTVSRRASTGSTRVARRAGATDATTVTTMPTSMPTTTVPASTWIGADGIESPKTFISATRPCAIPTPSARPAADDAAPTSTASARIVRITWRRVAPRARNSASSRVR